MQIHNKQELIDTLKIMEKHVSGMRAIAEIEDESMFAATSEVSLLLVSREVEKLSKFCHMKRKVDTRKSRIMKKVLGSNA